MDRPPAGTRPEDEGIVRTLATFGLAVGGPVSLAAGVGVVVTMTAGTPRALVAVAVLAGTLTAGSWIAFVVDDMQRRRRHRTTGGDGSLSGDG